MFVFLFLFFFMLMHWNLIFQSRFIHCSWNNTNTFILNKILQIKAIQLHTNLGVIFKTAIRSVNFRLSNFYFYLFFDVFEQKMYFFGKTTYYLRYVRSKNDFVLFCFVLYVHAFSFHPFSFLSQRKMIQKYHCSNIFSEVTHFNTGNTKLNHSIRCGNWINSCKISIDLLCLQVRYGMFIYQISPPPFVL